MIALPIIFGLLVLIIVAFGTCRFRTDVEGFSGQEPVLELHLHEQCQARCKSFIDNVWAPTSVWMNGPDGRGFTMTVIDQTDKVAEASMTKMDLATQDLTRNTHAVKPETYPVARVVYQGVPRVYTGPHDWPAFRRWLSTLQL